MGKTATEYPLLELVHECKISELFPNLPAETRLEASDVLAQGDYFYLVFDSFKQVGRITSDLAASRRNQLLGAAEAKAEMGYEGITYNPTAKRYYLLIEAQPYDDQYQSVIEEYDAHFKLLGRSWVNFPFMSCNKGFEGLDYLQRGGTDYVLALCEGNKCRDGKKGQQPGGGRIKVLEKQGETWEVADTLKLPKSVAFEDYAGLHLRGNYLAVVSQASSALWVGRLHRTRWEFVDEGQVYYFPRTKKGKIRYGNIEGVSWLSPSQVVVVSDKRKKGEQAKALGEVDQCVHIFKLPKE